MKIENISDNYNSMTPCFHPKLVNGPFQDPALYIDFLYQRRALLFDIGDITALSTRQIHKITEVSSSPYRGTSGLGRLTYEQSGGITNDTIDYTPIFASLFDDFVLACAIDISDEAFHGGKYGFSAVQVVKNLRQERISDSVELRRGVNFLRTLKL